MKILILCFIFLVPYKSFANNLIICSLRHADPIIKIAKKHSNFDKNRHCSVSCMLSLKCHPKEVLVVGYLKEFKDALGYGNPERADIRANKYGIQLVKDKRAIDNKECLEQCDLKY